MSKQNLQSIRDEIESAFEELGRQLARAEEPTAGVRAALEALQLALGPVLNGPEDAATGDMKTSHGRETAGAHVRRKQTGRHDARRLPAGYAFDGWSLMKPDGPGFGETVLTTEREQALAGSLISSITGWAERGQLGAVAPKLEAMFEIAFGFPFGARWRELLTSELEIRKRILDELSYRLKNGVTRPPMRLPNEPVADEARSGVDILAALRDEEGGDVPDALTAEAIEKMAELVGSRGGKTARKIVDEFAAGIEPKDRG